MNTISDSQLVPYHREPQQVRPLKPVAPRPVTAEGNPAAKRYAQMLPPRMSRHANQPESRESEYNSFRRLKNPKLNQVGLLIDIHA